MGLSTVKSLVLGFSLVDWTRLGNNGFDMIDYWRRCVYSAAATRRIANISCTCDPDEAFIAALMQDMGMPAIFTTMGDDYAQIVSRAVDQGDHTRLAAAEREVLQFDHAQAGAKLAERWRLPAEIIQAIRCHHASESTEQPDIVRAVTLGYLAASVLTTADNKEAIARFTIRSRDLFDLDSDAATRLLAMITDDARELSRLFQINTGAEPNVNALMTQAEEAALVHQLSMQRETDTLRQTATDLAHQAITDALTGVYNRKHFDTELARIFQMARSGGSSVAIVMVDADRFKTLNDMYGHQAGDAVLIEVSRRMRERIGGEGVVCRYGGEELAVILPGASRRTAAEVAENLRTAVAAAPVDLRNERCGRDDVWVTISLGVAVLEPMMYERLHSPQVLVHAADKALYAAKHAGRNCVRVFNPKPSVART